jgi:hypothetical protein
MVYPTFARVSLVAFPPRVSLEHCAESAQTSGAHRQTFGNFSVYAQHPLEGFSIFEMGGAPVSRKLTMAPLGGSLVLNSVSTSDSLRNGSMNGSL